MAPDRTLAGLLAGSPAAPALVTPGDDAGSLTYEQLSAGVKRLAGRLRGAGVGRGDRVALALPNGPELIGLLLAVQSLGAAAAPLNPSYTADEVAFYLDDLRPSMLVLPAGDLDAAREAAGGRTTVVDLARGAWPPRLTSDGVELTQDDTGPPAGEDDVALLLHTSGTTGRPKQVPLLHRNLVASAASIAEHYRLSASDVSYCAMPLFHVHGLVASTLAQLHAGGAVVVPRRVAPRRFWGQLADHGVTWYSAGPTLHRMLIDAAPDAGVGELRLRFARSCSSALDRELGRRIEAVLGVPVIEAYGMTEASHEMAASPLSPEERIEGSVGIATGAEIRVVDDRGRTVPESETGEVVVRGPGVMPGYLGDPRVNADAFHEEWFRTGDLGFISGRHLRLVGRIKEMINRGGEKISPLEVEDALLRHPAVAEAVAYGVPDQKYGELVGAAVVPRDQADPDELRRHCRGLLAPFKVPAAVRLVDAIPRTPTGKVQRPRMAAHFGEG